MMNPIIHPFSYSKKMSIKRSRDQGDDLFWKAIVPIGLKEARRELVY